MYCACGEAYSRLYDWHEDSGIPHSVHGNAFWMGARSYATGNAWIQRTQRGSESWPHGTHNGAGHLAYESLDWTRLDYLDRRLNHLRTTPSKHRLAAWTKSSPGHLQLQVLVLYRPVLSSFLDQ